MIYDLKFKIIIEVFNVIEPLCFELFLTRLTVPSYQKQTKNLTTLTESIPGYQHWLLRRKAVRMSDWLCKIIAHRQHQTGARWWDRKAERRRRRRRYDSRQFRLNCPQWAKLNNYYPLSLETIPLSRGYSAERILWSPDARRSSCYHTQPQNQVLPVPAISWYPSWVVNASSASTPARCTSSFYGHSQHQFYRHPTTTTDWLAECAVKLQLAKFYGFLCSLFVCLESRWNQA